MPGGRASIALAATLAVVLAAPATTVAVAPGTNVLISRPLGLGLLTTPTTNDSSVTGGGGTGPGSSEAARVVSTAENNRYVAFVSEADGLSAADDDAVTNVYLRDTATNTVQLVSRADGPAGVGANGDSYDPAISADGRYVAFTSEASNLEAGTGSGVSHIYLRNTLSGTTVLVDRADGANGAVANGNSFSPALTVVGNSPKVAFASEADNLDGSSTFTQVFYRNFQGDDTERVSLVDGTLSTPGDASSSSPAISADATTIAFATSATNLLGAPDNNNASDVYVRTLAANDTKIASLEGATLGDGDSYSPTINEDGNIVAFVSEATNWVGSDDASDDQDVYVRRFIPDLQVLASRADGAGGTKGNGNSRNVSINDSGQTLVFSSDATNLDSPDTNGVEDVFMRSGALGASPTTAPISRPENGVEADGPSTAPSIAGAVTPGLNFRVVFETRADNMGADDENDFTQVYSRLAGGALLPPNPARYLSRPDGSGGFRSGVNASVLRATTRGSEPVSSTSADGRYTVFMSQADELSDADDNRFVNVFRRDNQSGETMLISRASGAAGAAGNNESGALEGTALVSTAPAGAPSISADGSRVAFSSAADNLVPGDTNGRADVFVRDVAAATTTRVSVLPGGGEIATSGSVDPAISRDGNRVAFVTGAAIDPQDGNGDGDVYLRDIGAGVTTLISRRGIGAPSGDDSSGEPALDDDGSHVAFESFASDLAPAAVIDTTPVDPDVYLVNVATGGIQLVNPNAAVPMNTSDDGAFGPALDADASKVAFTSGSTNLGASGNLAGVDVFVRDIPTAQTELVSRTASAPSVSGNGSSEAPSIDAGGQRIAFESVASNLVGGDVNGPGSDVFVRDLAAGTTTLAALTPAGAQPVLGSEAASLSANGDCLVFQSVSDALFPMPPGTDFSKIFGRALRGDCPFAPISDGGGGSGDTDPPETTITKKPKKKSPKPKAKLAFTSDEAGSTFECALKGKRVKKKLKKFKPCDSGKVKYKKLKDGKKKFQVRATDAAGNVDASPAKAKWKVT